MPELWQKHVKNNAPPSFPVSGTGEKWEGGGSSIGDPHSGRRWCGRGCREIRRWFACVVTGLCQPSKIHDVHCWKFDTPWDTHSQHTCVCIYMIYVYMYMYIEIQQGDDIDTNTSYSGNVSWTMIFRACGMHVNFFAGADLIHTLFEKSAWSWADRISTFRVVERFMVLQEGLGEVTLEWVDMLQRFGERRFLCIVWSYGWSIWRRSCFIKSDVYVDGNHSVLIWSMYSILTCYGQCR